MSGQNTKIIIFNCLCLFLCGCANFPPAKTTLSAFAKQQPNIILITISSLRADHTSSLGYKRETTPAFDDFAKSNFLFTNAFSASSWQMPATASIFTSLYPSEHQVTHINNRLSEQVTTIAEILKANNYFTAAFCCNPRLTSENGFSQGFDIFDDYSVNMVLSAMNFENQQAIDINQQRTNDLINDAAIRWLKINTGKPFFLFVHFYDNHWDYLPPPPYDSLYDKDYHGTIDGRGIAKEPLYSNMPSDRDIEHIIALYDGQIRQTDQDISEFLNFIKEQGRFDDSMIILTADHGEQFYEHGNTSHHGIYDELIHIPLAVSIPDYDQTGVVDSMVSSVDIMPTILDFAGIEIPPESQGKSIIPLIKAEKKTTQDYIIAEYSGGAVADCRAVRFNDLKFIARDGQIFAFDLSNDPHEQREIRLDDFDQSTASQFDSIKDLLIDALPESNK